MAGVALAASWRFGWLYRSRGQGTVPVAQPSGDSGGGGNCCRRCVALKSTPQQPFCRDKSPNSWIIGINCLLSPKLKRLRARFRAISDGELSRVIRAGNLYGGEADVLERPRNATRGGCADKTDRIAQIGFQRRADPGLSSHGRYSGESGEFGVLSRCGLIASPLYG